LLRETFLEVEAFESLNIAIRVRSDLIGSNRDY